MKSDAQAIHTVKMLDYGVGLREVTGAIRTSNSEAFADARLIIMAVYPDGPSLAHPATYLVKTHADKLVRNVGLGPACRGTQLRDGVIHAYHP